MKNIDEQEEKVPEEYEIVVEEVNETFAF